MNQPTREEFEAFKQEIRQEVRQLREQRTEEMKAVRVDVHNVDVEAIRQELKTVSDTWLDTLQEHYDEHKADFLKLQESQADFRDTLKTAKDDIASIKATQDAQGQRQDTMDSKLDQILALLQTRPGE